MSKEMTSSSPSVRARWLAAITPAAGNVGIPGGNSGTSNGATGNAGIKGLPAGTNPLGAAALGQVVVHDGDSHAVAHDGARVRAAARNASARRAAECSGV